MFECCLAAAGRAAPAAWQARVGHCAGSPRRPPLVVSLRFPSGGFGRLLRSRPWRRMLLLCLCVVVLSFTVTVTLIGTQSAMWRTRGSLSSVGFVLLDASRAASARRPTASSSRSWTRWATPSTTTLIVVELRPDCEPTTQRRRRRRPASVFALAACLHGDGDAWPRARSAPSNAACWSGSIITSALATPEAADDLRRGDLLAVVPHLVVLSAGCRRACICLRISSKPPWCRRGRRVR